MTGSLETAEHPENLKRVVIEPVTRIEGHGKVTLLLDEENHIRQARLHIVEFRGFEKFIQGRPYWELPVVVQRLCGICPVSHHLAAAKAVDTLVGVTALTPTAEKVRRLMHLGQTLQSHALHFFHLSSPDLLFGFDDDATHRNLVALVAEQPDIAMKGIKLRKFGQEIIRMTAGRRVHGTAAIPGGVNKSIAPAERDYLLADTDQIIQWGHDAIQLIKKIYEAHSDVYSKFGKVRSNLLSLVGADGGLELYHGRLRARQPDGRLLFDRVNAEDYHDHIHEQVKPWSYMKFPFLTALGSERGWYRVGPLARLNNCDYIATPLAEAERKVFVALDQSEPVHSLLATHWARMIELLYAAEGIRELLLDEDILGKDLVVARGDLNQEGVGVIEAPRGTLLHHYRINEDGLVEKANLIVSTTHNNQAMNESIRHVAAHHLDGKVLTEPLLNHIEVAIRAYDPCLSCATHALGKMPLQIELLDSEGSILDRMIKSSSGEISCDL